MKAVKKYDILDYRTRVVLDTDGTQVGIHHDVTKTEKILAYIWTAQE